MKHVAKAIRKSYGEARVIVGGPNPRSVHRKRWDHPWKDDVTKEQVFHSDTHVKTVKRKLTYHT